MLRSIEGDPAGLGSLEEDLASGAIRLLPIAEWSPETIAAYERAHLGFLTASRIEVQKHKTRLVEEFGVTNIADLVDVPDKASASVGAIVTNLRLRTTKKGDRMAWLTLAGATGAIEAAVFPQAFERLTETADGESALREGAFLVARGRLSHEESTGPAMDAAAATRSGLGPADLASACPLTACARCRRRGGDGQRRTFTLTISGARDGHVSGCHARCTAQAVGTTKLYVPLSVPSPLSVIFKSRLES